eukprot:1441533-Pyramimonas_sp.AAC.1
MYVGPAGLSAAKHSDTPDYSAVMATAVFYEGRHYWELLVPFASKCSRLYVGAVQVSGPAQTHK